MTSSKKNLEAQLLRLLKLPADVSILNSKFTDDSEILTLQLPATKRMCPLCGSNDCIVRGSGKWQELKTFPVDNRRVILRIFKRRMFCRDCQSSFYESPDWIFPRLRMTKSLFKSIFKKLTEMADFSEISDTMLIGESTVRTVFNSIDLLHPKKLPETLCIDEFHADSGFYNKKHKKWLTDDYNVNVTDWDRRIVVDVLQQKNLAFLSKYFRKQYNKYQRDAVRFFVCDMNGAFISLAKECFPKATICVDNFHVVQRLSKAVTDVRRRLQNTYKANEDITSYNLMKHLQYPLLIFHIHFHDKYGDKAEEKRLALEAAFQIAPDLKEAYDAYQDFLEILASFPFSIQKEND